MVMSVVILHGFQKEIRHKVSGFGSHITVKPLAVGTQLQANTMRLDCPEVARLRSLPQITCVQPVATIGGMLKNDEQIYGILLKGINTDYDTSFFHQSLIEGHLPHVDDSNAQNEVMLSQTIARKMRIGMGDKVRAYFWDSEGYRARMFKICGIYNTDLADYDDHFLVGSLRQVQSLRNWDSNEAEGLELLVSDFSALDATCQQVAQNIPYDLGASTIVDQDPAIFSWLNLLDSNIFLILGLMALVCVVSVVSVLLIMIFEKTSAIGLLKTLGCSNRSIRAIFLIKSARIVALGILIGDALSLTLSLIQRCFHIIKLSPESYSMTEVPIDLDPWVWILVSAATFVVCLLALIVPSSYIARIAPAKTLRVE